MAKNRTLISEDSLEEALSCKGLVFDTNIWLRVQGYFTDPKDKRSRTYSWFYKKALEKECPIFLPAPVLSEFVGVSLNAKARETGWKREHGKIHKCSDFKEWMSDISDDAYHLINDCALIDDQFTGFEIDSLFSSAANGGIDFNDLLIAEICKMNGLSLVTDDIDMKGQAVDIITANRNITV